MGLFQNISAETVTGENYFKTINPNGIETFQTHWPYIQNGNTFVPFVNNGNEVRTWLDTVTLNPDGSYTWTDKGITDKIVAKYADITNQNSWTYPNTLNSDVPDVSWNGTSFVSSKIKTGVGQLDYKYVLIGGKWKTQLEATNLSGLTTKVFGFDQTVDIKTDKISFGGIERNLDNYNNTTFSKAFLTANEGKILNLNGINFDFDLGYNDLYSVTVYDTCLLYTSDAADE